MRVDGPDEPDCGHSEHGDGRRLNSKHHERTLRFQVPIDEPMGLQIRALGETSVPRVLHTNLNAWQVMWNGCN